MLRVSVEFVELLSSESLALGSGSAPRLRNWKNRYKRLNTSPIVVFRYCPLVYN